MNNIAVKQDQEPSLRLLRARQQTYRVARRWQITQLILTLLVPTAGALLLIWFPAYRPAIALVSLSVALLDALVLDRRYRQSLKKAASIAERFDCELFELPWDHFTVKTKISHEEIHSASQAYARYTDDTRLIGWYPKEIAAVPLHLARLICQRTNLTYDSNLRYYYRMLVLGFGLFVSLALLLIGFIQNQPLQDFVLTLVPAATIMTWCAREYFRQKDTSDKAAELRTEIEKLWSDVQKGSADEKQCLEQSRQFQTGIFLWRAAAPLGIPYLYDWLRNRLEEEMHVGAAELIKELDLKAHA